MKPTTKGTYFLNKVKGNLDNSLILCPLTFQREPYFGTSQIGRGPAI